MKTVHVVAVDNFFPDLCELTFPTMERWARNIGARFNIISRRRWADWPVYTEKLQVWHEGRDSEWNVLVDADVLIHPETPDIFGTFVGPRQIGVKDGYAASKVFASDDVFKRDSRDIGISACVVATSDRTHELWQPIDEEMTLEEVCANILTDRKSVDEYCLSRNCARRRYDVVPVLPPKLFNCFFHLDSAANKTEKTLAVARKWLEIHWK